MAAQRIMTFGVVVGNRGFFPDHLAKSGREEIISVLQAAGCSKSLGISVADKWAEKRSLVYLSYSACAAA